MKQILTTALLTACLCASAVFAAAPRLDENAAPKSEYERGYTAVERSFSLTPGPDWEQLQESIESSYIKDYGVKKISREKFFPVYYFVTNQIGPMRELAAALRDGRKVPELMELISPGQRQEYGVFVCDASGAVIGELLVDNTSWGGWSHDNTSYAAFDQQAADREVPRYALRMDRNVKRQLNVSGLDLPRTRAYSIAIDRYGYGILFDDGNQQCFMRQAFWEYTADSLKKGHPVSEVYGDTGSTYPSVASRLELDKIVPISDLIDDLERLCEKDWYVYTPPGYTGKPVIYLYPEKETDVSVKLRFGGDLTYTYPAYGDGWNVTAYPDGRIVNKADGSEHYYLFWEGVSDGDWTFDQGFCVKGTDTEAFLREKLPLLGLTPREYNDFITYWVPKMQGSPYNLIKFADTEYDKLASLTVTPKPDTIARIHMVYKPLEKPVEIPPQSLSGFDRKGFTVVEWGGTEAGASLKIEKL